VAAHHREALLGEQGAVVRAQPGDLALARAHPRAHVLHGVREIAEAALVADDDDVAVSA
jgi:hypothetical protein